MQTVFEVCVPNVRQPEDTRKRIPIDCVTVFSVINCAVPLRTFLAERPTFLGDTLPISASHANKTVHLPNNLRSNRRTVRWCQPKTTAARTGVHSSFGKRVTTVIIVAVDLGYVLLRLPSKSGQHTARVLEQASQPSTSSSAVGLGNVLINHLFRPASCLKANHDKAIMFIWFGS